MITEQDIERKMARIPKEPSPTDELRWYFDTAPADRHVHYTMPTGVGVAQQIAEHEARLRAQMRAERNTLVYGTAEPEAIVPAHQHHDGLDAMVYAVDELVATAPHMQANPVAPEDGDGPNVADPDPPMQMGEDMAFYARREAVEQQEAPNYDPDEQRFRFPALDRMLGWWSGRKFVTAQEIVRQTVPYEGPAREPGPYDFEPANAVPNPVEVQEARPVAARTATTAATTTTTARLHL